MTYLRGHWPFWLAGVVLARLVIAAMLEKGVSTFDRISFVGIGAVLILFYWRNYRKQKSEAGIGEQEASRSELHFVTFLEIFGVMATAVGLMAPRPAVESRPGAIERLATVILDAVQGVKRDTEDIKDDQRKIVEAVGAGEPSLIRQHINGVWGEEGCPVTYRFTLQDKMLAVQSLKNAGMKPYSPEYTVNSETKQRLGAGRTGIDHYG